MHTKNQPTRIVGIDDDPVTISYLDGLLSVGYEFYGVTDSVAGLEVISKVLPDLILLDYKLPVLDGLEVLERLHTAESTKDIPVILVTAFEEDLTAKLVSHNQVVGIVPKPLDAHYLLSAIEDGLSLHHMVTIRRRLLSCY